MANKNSKPLLKILVISLLLVALLACIFYIFFKSNRKPFVVWKYYNPNMVGKTQSIYKDKVFTETLDGNIIALNTEDGKELWKTHVETIMYSKLPSVVSDTLLIQSSENTFVPLELNNGQKTASPSGKTIQPVYSDSITTPNARYTITCEYLFIQIDSCTRRLRAYDMNTGRSVWTWPRAVNTPLVSDGINIYFLDGNYLYAVR